jgi:hypothetical protein
MKKFVATIPLIIALIAAVWVFVDPTVGAYLAAHPALAAYLAAALAVSETLALTPVVKSNAVVQAFFDLGLFLLKKIIESFQKKSQPS